jgi:hypothetical protein
MPKKRGHRSPATRAADAVSAAGWSRGADGLLACRPIRCRRDEWYLARACPAQGVAPSRAVVLLRFLADGQVLRQRAVGLHAVPGLPQRGELLGWLETPKDTTHLQVCLPEAALDEQIAELAFHRVTERDPKCHPLANTPRWETYQPPFTLQRVLLPASLAALQPTLAGSDVQIIAPPASAADLARTARGNALVLDPQWVTALKLTLADVERIAAGAWVLVDLETLVRLAARAGHCDAELATYAAGNGTMSARIEYADVPTRGLALQDVVPFSTIQPDGRFSVQAIRATRSWKRYADEVGFATLLSGETPWDDKHGDIISALRPVGGGELVATDLPWLVAGQHGPLLAPRIAAHLLRMHVGGPLKPHAQYWNRWNDGDVVVRDISDLPLRYAPLFTARWAARDPQVAHLGIVLPAAGVPRRQLVLKTGRIDTLAVHDGLPPEPLMILMKWLAREVREQTAWAQQHLADTTVIWQFDAAEGIRFACNYDAAEASALPTTLLRLRLEQPRALDPGRARQGAIAAAPDAFIFETDEGLHGDRSLEFQDELTKQVCRRLKQV